MAIYTKPGTNFVFDVDTNEVVGTIDIDGDVKLFSDSPGGSSGTANIGNLNTPSATEAASTQEVVDALTLKADKTTTYTKTEVDNRVASLVASAPATLDTLNELASALGNDANFATTIATSLGGKQNTLESGINMKTINNLSLLGSGNIDITGGASVAEPLISTQMIRFRTAIAKTKLNVADTRILVIGQMFATNQNADWTKLNARNSSFPIQFARLFEHYGLPTNTDNVSDSLQQTFVRVATNDPRISFTGTGWALNTNRLFTLASRWHTNVVGATQKVDFGSKIFNTLTLYFSRHAGFEGVITVSLDGGAPIATITTNTYPLGINKVVLTVPRGTHYVTISNTSGFLQEMGFEISDSTLSKTVTVYPIVFGSNDVNQTGFWPGMLSVDELNTLQPDLIYITAGDVLTSSYHTNIAKRNSFKGELTAFVQHVKSANTSPSVILVATPPMNTAPMPGTQTTDAEQTQIATWVGEVATEQNTPFINLNAQFNGSYTQFNALGYYGTSIYDLSDLGNIDVANALFNPMKAFL